MAGSVGSTSTSTAASNTVSGTHVPPISFPGIASGIDYNAIIQKYTDLTLLQEKPLQTQLTDLNAQQAELFKIQSLINTFQDTFKSVSASSAYFATGATVSAGGAATASNIANTTAAPGTTTIQSTALATATQIANDPAANQPITGTATTLFTAGFSITPSNGDITGQNLPGILTVNGVQIQYDVNSDTINSLNAQLTAKGANAQFTYNAGTGKITLTSTTGSLTIGSAADRGNILSVFKLDSSPVIGNAVTSSAGVGGINRGATLNTANNAGFATPVTAGTFTINGVKFSVDPTKNNLNDLLSEINGSNAGVLASYDTANDRVLLTSKQTGAQGIALGSAADTSNFLQAVGFLANATTPGTLSAGAVQTNGQAAKVVYLDAQGNPVTVYSQSNDLTNVVPGIDLKITASTNTPFTVTVATDSSGIEKSLGDFTKAYNAVIDEINTSTAAPVIGAQTNASTGATSSQTLAKGGVLYNNQDVLSVRDQLVNLVSSFGNTGSRSYNSLSSIGLQLDSSFTVNTASSSSGNSKNADQITAQSFAGTSGRLQDLDVTKFRAAIAADPTAVSKLFTGSASIIGRLGSYLTTATGLPTQLDHGLAGSIPRQSLFSIYTSSASDRIQSLQKQIQLITDQANMQADTLRRQFLAAETTIAQLQSQQSAVSQLSALSSR